MFIVQGVYYDDGWSSTLVIAGLILSMTMNALVTELIVFRIFKVFQEVKTATADYQTLGRHDNSETQLSDDSDIQMVDR